jgi:H+/Cl- antiporter ClcA
LSKNSYPKPRLTADEIRIRVWAFVVLAVVGVFVGITSMMLYSLTFVNQPMKAMAPIDQAYTKMLNDIVLLIVGAIGGIATEKGLGMVSGAIAQNHEEPPK